MTVQDDFAREDGQGDDGEAGRSPVVSDDGGASDGGGAPDGEGAGSGFGSEGDGPGEREAKLPPAPGFSAPDDVELLVRASTGAALEEGSGCGLWCMMKLLKMPSFSHRPSC